MRLLVLLLLAASASAQPLRIADVSVPSAPRATEGELVMIPLTVRVENTGRNERHALVTARLAGGAETEFARTSEPIAAGATANLRVVLPVDLRSGSVPSSLTAETLVYTNRDTQVGSQSLVLSVARRTPPAEETPPARPATGTVQIDPRIAQRPRIPGGPPELRIDLRQNIGIVTAAVAQTFVRHTDANGLPNYGNFDFDSLFDTREDASPTAEPPPSPDPLVGYRLVVILQNTGNVRRPASPASLRITTTKNGQPHHAYTLATHVRQLDPGGVFPLSVEIGSSPAEVCIPDDDDSPYGTIFRNIGPGFGGPWTYPTLPLPSEWNTTGGSALNLRIGETFGVTVSLTAEGDTGDDDNILEFTGHIADGWRMASGAPTVRGPIRVRPTQINR